MRQLQKSEITIYRFIDPVWDDIVSLERNGHLWMPHTAAVIKKTIGATEEHTLFQLSHFSSDSLCRVTRLIPKSEIKLEIANEYAHVQIRLILVADANAVQLTTIVQGKIHGWRSWLGPFAYWYMKRVFVSMPIRIRKMVTQPD